MPYNRSFSPPRRNDPYRRPVAAHRPKSVPKTGGSVEALRVQSGLSIRDLASRTGVNRNRVHRILSGKGRPRSREIAALRQAMDDVIRRQRSSDPDFLRRIQEIVVPFLESRLRQAPPPARPAIRLIGGTP